MAYVQNEMLIAQVLGMNYFFFLDKSSKILEGEILLLNGYCSLCLICNINAKWL